MESGEGFRRSFIGSSILKRVWNLWFCICFWSWTAVLASLGMKFFANFSINVTSVLVESSPNINFRFCEQSRIRNDLNNNVLLKNVNRLKNYLLKNHNRDNLYMNAGFKPVKDWVREHVAGESLARLKVRQSGGGLRGPHWGLLQIPFPMLYQLLDLYTRSW